MQIGTLECDLTGSSVSCTHRCPSGYYFESNGTLETSGSVFCNSSMSAQWSHMSTLNPLGELPKCAGEYQMINISNFYLHSVINLFMVWNKKGYFDPY